MRRDMAKVIIDRPRQNSRDRASALKGRDRRRYLETGKLSRSSGTKSFKDRNNPVRRYLMNWVGKPWNDCWSDVCSVAPMRKGIALHLRVHVRDEVSISTQRNQVERGQWKRFWVDSQGILRDNGPRKKWKGSNSWLTPIWIISPHQQYQMIPADKNGIWYVLNVEELPKIRQEYKDSRGRVYYVIWTHAYDEATWAFQNYGRYVRVTAKRQLNTRELKMLGLVNGVMVEANPKKKE